MIGDMIGELTGKIIGQRIKRRHHTGELKIERTHEIERKDPRDGCNLHCHHQIVGKTTGRNVR